MTPDNINAVFELGGALVTLLSVHRILKDRAVRGFDWRVIGFFTAWGAWNLFYYPHLEQWVSTAAAVALVVVNFTYLVLILRFRKN